MDINKVRTDEKKSEEGTWVDIEHDADGNVVARLLVARANNTKFQEYLRQIGKPYRRQIQADTMDQKLLTDLHRKAVARHVLLGWEGLFDNGAELEYSVENAERLLRMPYFSDIVESASSDLSLFFEETLKEDAKQAKKQ